jgi:hypothetical protein
MIGKGGGDTIMTKSVQIRRVTYIKPDKLEKKSTPGVIIVNQIIAKLLENAEKGMWEI